MEARCNMPAGVDREEIMRAISRCSSIQGEPSQAFGTGEAAGKIVDLLIGQKR